jgi:putative ABC transport system substrate-binding protein
LKRRNFVLGLFLSAVAQRVRSEEQRKNRIAVFVAVTPAHLITEGEGGAFFRIFFSQLARLGHIDGQNLSVERFSAEGHIERYPEIARQIVDANPDLIVTANSNIGAAVGKVTKTIPIVSLMGDPIRFGLVASLARPGGNITGAVTDAGMEVLGKRLQLLMEAVPSAAKIAYLGTRFGVEGPPGQMLKEWSTQLRIPIITFPINQSTASEYERVFAEIAKERPDALLLGEAGEFFAYRKLIVELAEKARLPAMYAFREFITAGGLMAYAVDQLDLSRRMADQVHQILTGGNPAEIPVQQATRFAFIVNRKAARAQNFGFPPSLLARADEVVE